jgi:hypothetical protein
MGRMVQNEKFYFLLIEPALQVGKIVRNCANVGRLRDKKLRILGDFDILKSASGG